MWTLDKLGNTKALEEWYLSTVIIKKISLLANKLII